MAKQGISPLMATIILIVFSVGLGAIVMSWGEAYIEQSANLDPEHAESVLAECGSISLSVIEVKGTPQVCVQNGQIQAFFENGPDQEITRLQANIIGGDGVDINTNILSGVLAKTAAKKESFDYNSVGEILQIKFTPVIEGEEELFCTEEAVVIEDIAEC